MNQPGTLCKQAKQQCKQKSKQRPSATWWLNFATFFGSKLKVTLVLSSLKKPLTLVEPNHHNGHTQFLTKIS